MLKEPSTEATGKMKSDLRTTSGDNKSNSLVDDLNNSKTIQTHTICNHLIAITPKTRLNYVPKLHSTKAKNLVEIISIITIDIVTFLYIS
jgi:GTP cyclohydrolase I